MAILPTVTVSESDGASFDASFHLAKSCTFDARFRRAIQFVEIRNILEVIVATATSQGAGDAVGGAAPSNVRVAVEGALGCTRGAVAARRMHARPLEY